MSTVVALVVLCVPALLPAFAISGISPTTPFLVPLMGAAMAAVAACLEIVVAGSLAGWFIVVAVLANAAAATWLAMHGRRGRGVTSGDRSSPAEELGDPGPLWWQGVCLAFLLAAVAWPLYVLKTPIASYDTAAVWLLHADMIFGGHHAMIDAFTNPAYAFSNPDYPPLIPAVGSLTYSTVGHIDQRPALQVLAIVNASMVGLVATGLLRIVPANGTLARRWLALVVACGFCIGTFGVGGPSTVDGSADLTWAAAALAAVVFGLVLPRSGRTLALAWVCVVAASLTKNEGFLVSIVISTLIAFRYLGPPLDVATLRPRELRDTVVGFGLRRWAWLAGAAALPLGAAIIWAGAIRALGITSDFFGAGRGVQTSVPSRFDQTVPALAIHLWLAPVAVGVLILGTVGFRHQRQRLRVASPAWLWVVIGWSLLALGGTYVFGALPIHQWLKSTYRTTEFAQVSLLASVVIWSFVVMAAGVRSDPPAATARAAEGVAVAGRREPGRREWDHEPRSDPDPEEREAVPAESVMRAAADRWTGRSPTRS